MGDMSSSPVGVLINCVTLEQPMTSAPVLPHQGDVYSSEAAGTTQPSEK